MSRFTEFTSVRIPNKNCKYFELTDDLVYERWFEWSGIFTITPKGTKTDFASIPWILQFTYKPWDSRWNLWAIQHDWRWENATTLCEMQDANDEFYEAMQVTWTPKWLAIIAYVSVSISKYFYYFLKYGKPLINRMIRLMIAWAIRIWRRSRLISSVQVLSRRIMWQNRKSDWR